MCASASGSLAGERPRFAATEAWTLGTEASVPEQGHRADKTRFVIFRAKRVGKVTSTGTFSPLSDTPAEEVASRAALDLVAAGDTTTKNGFVDFIRGHLGSGAWVEGAFEGKSLYFAEPGGRGSLIALRQKGNTLCVAERLLAGGPSGWDLHLGSVLGSAPLRPLQ